MNRDICYHFYQNNLTKIYYIKIDNKNKLNQTYVYHGNKESFDKLNLPCYEFLFETNIPNKENNISINITINNYINE